METTDRFPSIDLTNWPDEIPKDPHNPIWEFIYNGEQYFMYYYATPAHVNRQRRHFYVMMLAITTRWVLKEFNKKKDFAKTIKAGIRKKLVEYDSIPMHHLPVFLTQLPFHLYY